MAPLVKICGITNEADARLAVDAGADYADYRRALGAAGLPVFDRVETGLLGLQTLA